MPTESAAGHAVDNEAATHNAAHDAADDAADDAAEDVLVALRGEQLVRSWRTSDGGYEVLVGRGTVGLAALTAAGVLALAGDLRRDQVTVIGRGYPMGYRTTRYELSDGRFLDRYDSRRDRYLDDHPYSVFVPGGDPSGGAALSFAARTQKEALALAGLARVRGRCTRCAYLRPLTMQNHQWRPDPTIRCPGCDADARTAITLLCHRCRQPIVPTTHPGGGLYRDAWTHEATRTSFCDNHNRHPGYSHDDRRAQLR